MNTPLLRHLAQRIAAIEDAERPLIQTTVPLALPVLSEAFSAQGLPAGSLVELLSAVDGAGAWTLALILARHACGERKILVVADGPRCFYPPAACRLGIDLRRTLVIRPKEREHAISALAQALRCPAVGAVLGGFERLTSPEYRRLQLAAETGGAVGLLVRPASARTMPSFASIRLRVAPCVCGELNRRIQVEVLRRRGGKAGQTFLLEIDHETGHVRVPAAVAAATTVARAPRTPG